MSLLGNLYCKPEVTRDHLKRDIEVEINWPATGIGSRRIVHCPHAYEQPLYANRDCKLAIVDRTPKWSYANVTMCPVPPFSQGVERLARFLVRDLSSVGYWFGGVCSCASVSLCAKTRSRSQSHSNWSRSRPHAVLVSVSYVLVSSLKWIICFLN